MFISFGSILGLFIAHWIWTSYIEPNNNDYY